MKSRSTVAIFITLTVIIMLGSCNANLTAAYKNTSAILDSSSFPPKTSSTIDNNHPEPIAILFLIDKSGSIIGVGENTARCNGEEISEKRLPHNGAQYLTQIFSQMPKEYSESIHLGISEFGDKYAPVINFTSADKLGDISILDDYSYTAKSTDYAIALAQGYKDLETYARKHDITKQIIIIMTDGFHTNRDSIEPVLQNIPLDVQIYAYLVCPKNGDTSFWAKHRISTSKFPDEWLNNFWQIPEVKQALPIKSGWIYKDSKQEVFIDGAANEVYFKYFSRASETGTHFTINGHDDFSFNKIPNQGCEDHKFLLESQITDAGFWWVETKKPDIDKIIISISPLINDDTAELQVHLSGRDFNSGEMAKWRDCYKDNDFTFEITSSDGRQLNHSPLNYAGCREGGNGLCSEDGGNGLYGTWFWDPPQLENPTDIFFKSQLIAPDSSNSLAKIESKTYKIPLVFRPEFVSMIIPKLPDKEQYFWDLKFNFDINQPNVYLLRSSEEEDLSWEDCPVVVQIPGTTLQGYFVHQYLPDDSLPSKLDAVAISTWRKGVGNYQLRIKRAVIDKCGFDKVTLIWDNKQWSGDLGKLPPEDE